MNLEVRTCAIQYGGGAYVFPAESRAAFATIDVADSVVPRCHRAVVGLAFHNINTTEEMSCFLMIPCEQAYTPSKRYALPCWPLKA